MPGLTHPQLERPQHRTAAQPAGSQLSSQLHRVPLQAQPAHSLRQPSRHRTPSQPQKQPLSSLQRRPRGRILHSALSTQPLQWALPQKGPGTFKWDYMLTRTCTPDSSLAKAASSRYAFLFSHRRQDAADIAKHLLKVDDILPSLV